MLNQWERVETNNLIQRQIKTGLIRSQETEQEISTAATSGGAVGTESNIHQLLMKQWEEVTQQIIKRVTRSSATRKTK